MFYVDKVLPDTYTLTVLRNGDAENRKIRVKNPGEPAKSGAEGENVQHISQAQGSGSDETLGNYAGVVPKRQFRSIEHMAGESFRSCNGGALGMHLRFFSLFFHKDRLIGKESNNG